MSIDVANNSLYDSDSSKHKYIHDEISKYGKGNISAKIFTYNELSDATKSFASESLLGEGGFGRVYKGYIDSFKQVILNALTVSLP